MRALTFAVAGLLAGTGVTSPAELLITEDAPRPFVLADGAAADLTFVEYAPLSPDAIAHVDPDSDEATTMRAAVDVWTAEADDILLREVTLWSDPEAARAFVEQSVVVGRIDGLQMIDAPFDGGVAFVGDDSGLRSRTLTWRQGPYAMSVSHFAANASTDDVINATAEALAAVVEAGTGNEIVASGVLPERADAVDRVDPTDPSAGGIPIATVLVWILVIGGGIWLAMSVKKRLTAGRTGVGELQYPSTTRPAGDDVADHAGARSGYDAETTPDPGHEQPPPGT